MSALGDVDVLLLEIDGGGLQLARDAAESASDLTVSRRPR
jgi:hypothetical protein